MKLSDEMKVSIIGVIIMFALMPFDLQILQYVDIHRYCRAFYDATTDIGLGKWYVYPSGLLFVLGLALWAIKKLPAKLIPFWRGITFFFFSVAGAGLVTDIIKRIVARARPVEYLQHHVTGIFHWHEAMASNSAGHFASFPSGHSTTVFAVAVAISFLLPDKWRAGRILINVVALILAFSRIMVEAHYASDVMAGILVGCLTTLAVKTYVMPYWDTKVLKLNQLF